MKFFCFTILNNKLNLHYTESVAVMALQESQYITSLSKIFSWMHQGHVMRLSNDFYLIETIVPFVFLLRDKVELSTSVTVYLKLSSSVISVFSCFQYSLDLKKGHTVVCYLVTICLRNF